ncbi:Follistatin-related protein 5 [Sarcoptes scabiei]|uniref:Follistatin-related protein 5 n=1 Tax=Sarcoptes scabiei TaxID=52283 RepID=A0A834VBU0_SARSC|nr:Follistatin-related protein 5 [Sarcoptes scabiei]
MISKVFDKFRLCSHLSSSSSSIALFSKSTTSNLLPIIVLISIILIGEHHRIESNRFHRRLLTCSSQQTLRCPVHKHKICGSDGKLYPSRCHLRRASCDTNTLIRPAHPDRCSKDYDQEESSNNSNNNKFNNLIESNGFNPNNAINLIDSTIDQRSSSISGLENLPNNSISMQNGLKQIKTNQNNGNIQSDNFDTEEDGEEGEEDGEQTNSSVDDENKLNLNVFGDKKKIENRSKSDPNRKERKKSNPEMIDRNIPNDDDGGEDECHPKQYDLMKEKILEKINDVSLLFTRLDENSDGKITLQELWKHSMIYKSSDSECLLTDLMQHEDLDDDDKLDYSEFQSAFNKIFSVSMVSLDENLAINRIDAHLGDNVEIRCDINGEPQRPAIKWYRHGVDLSTINLPFLKVFNDGSLYLTDLKLSFSGNYCCQAVNNPTVKQIHIVHVIVDPIVEVLPRFQWTPIGGVANFECIFETFDDQFIVHWFKNNEQLVDGPKVTIINNGTLLQVAALEQIDTGAYTCRVSYRNGAFGQSVASLLVQDDSVESFDTVEHHSHQEKLWIFHSNGITIYEGVCGQTIHEIDGRDIIHQNFLTLCGSNNNNNNNNNDNENNNVDVDRSGLVSCDWSDDIVELNGLIYIAQPSLNRILVLNQSQMNVVQIIATDPRPRKLKAIEFDGKDPQIWILCDGNPDLDRESFQSYQKSSIDWSAMDFGSIKNSKQHKMNLEKYRKNRKTIQVIRVPIDHQHQSKGSRSNQNEQLDDNLHHHHHHIQNQHHHQLSDVIHLQPIDGHFDLVYDLFMPDHYESIFSNRDHSKRLRTIMQDSPYAYAAHWEERSLIKISINQLEYIESIRLADCQPISASIIGRKAGGLVAIQCQTPITHQLNGQLILDQITDAILIHNSNINAHQSFLSPDHRYLVSVFHDQKNYSGSFDWRTGKDCSGQDPSWCRRSSRMDHHLRFTNNSTSTIIVQKITDRGIEFMYDVRTSLDIVNCLFVWKNGFYNLILASGTPNREDLLYLSLSDGHVELISGIGRPTGGHHRGMALSRKNRILSITATESVFTVDLVSNRIICESNKRFKYPKTLLWTN